MNEFDTFIKHVLKVRYYARYTDDFIIVSNNQEYLRNIIFPIKDFLKEKLQLELHPKKVSIRKLHQGIDFLGYVVFPKHCLIRTKTKRRILTKLKKKILAYKSGNISELTLRQSLQSYLGVLSHANAYRLAEELKNMIWFLS